ncbi:hypothetical protein Csp1_20550 [Corynebacterium provencense]|uniref:HTH marR-type domain-containing protein n=1 Tax=Corynebacterium provencense TaxID=1737425 RepID=A0A2Z3YRC8_9CORY|nr:MULTISPECIES: MarR family transcriptional regulator [Corynebacterium]AWT26819.1 hypothetical protein Csp1_20550 [Corynebacterium provencense]
MADDGIDLHAFSPRQLAETCGSGTYSGSDDEPGTEMPVVPPEPAPAFEVMRALGRLRTAERECDESSRRYMRISGQGMHAVRYLMAAQRQDIPVTPTMIAEHLGISRASTTRLLRRLEEDGHIVRRISPGDHRAFLIEVTAPTAAAARSRVGQVHARRLGVAAALTDTERATVISFLDRMTAVLTTPAETGETRP